VAKVDASHLLIVDDERSIRAALRTILSSTGFTLVEATHGLEALSLIHAAHFDAILLDINLPDLSGIEVCRQIRKSWPRLPVIMLTVADDEDSKVEALEAGADHYVTKPFHVGELIARLRQAIRRYNSVDEDETQRIIVIGEVLLDPSRHLVEKEGKAVHLTPKQFELLHYLMAHAGRPIPHAKLLRSVWGGEYGEQVEYLRTFIRQIRIKIEDDPANPRYLLTDSHIGYRFSEGMKESA
jgi:two-component system, OmpR family, KDP operon response regulator KdpE